MKRSILVTGAHGFIGQALLAVLRKKYPASTCYGLSRSPKGSSQIFHCDLTRAQDVAGIFSKITPHWIFHMAGGRYSDPQKLLQSNYTATETLLHAVQKIPNYSPRIIIPGTAAEYGPARAEHLIREDEPARPVSAYGKIKHQQTRLALKFAQKGMDIVIARIFNILGDGTPADLVAGRFASKIARLEKNSPAMDLLVANLDGNRDFLDIADVCSAFIALAEKGQSGEIYNVCSGKPVSIRRLLDGLRKMSTRREEITIEAEPQRQSQSFDAIGSNMKLKKRTGWTPRISFQKSLQLTLAYYRKMERSKEK